jgi:hypothetical protein
LREIQGKLPRKKKKPLNMNEYNIDTSMIDSTPLLNKKTSNSEDLDPNFVNDRISICLKPIDDGGSPEQVAVRGWIEYNPPLNMKTSKGSLDIDLRCMTILELPTGQRHPITHELEKINKEGTFKWENEPLDKVCRFFEMIITKDSGEVFPSFNISFHKNKELYKLRTEYTMTVKVKDDTNGDDQNLSKIIYVRNRIKNGEECFSKKHTNNVKYNLEKVLIDQL